MGLSQIDKYKKFMDKKGADLIFFDFMLDGFGRLSSEDLSVLCVVVWMIWFLHNAVVHGSTTHNAEEVVDWARNYVNELRENDQPSDPQPPQQRRPPPKGRRGARFRSPARRLSSRHRNLLSPPQSLHQNSRVPPRETCPLAPDSVQARPRLGHLNSLISLYSKCGDSNRADTIFKSMGKKRNLVSWSAMISCLANCGRELDAVQMFVETLERGFRPNEFTLSGVVSACMELESLTLGKQLHSWVI
ncbi:hypothetical protein Dsin_012132 [Dipteronia sinensis]|uniref:Pentatricopeptide repeat-containing protein n=1 Tax=Dipteronia sinensis TaxID=43782 RepID=A0AAE0AHI3_9ROSI|nr:hypothetical protein Dsin_012132 [Dipteronia sinensis]